MGEFEAPVENSDEYDDREGLRNVLRYEWDHGNIERQGYEENDRSKGNGCINNLLSFEGREISWLQNKVLVILEKKYTSNHRSSKEEEGELCSWREFQRAKSFCYQ